jgi:ribonuclease R
MSRSRAKQGRATSRRDRRNRGRAEDVALVGPTERRSTRKGAEAEGAAGDRPGHAKKGAEGEGTASDRPGHAKKGAEGERVERAIKKGEGAAADRPGHAKKGEGERPERASKKGHHREGAPTERASKRGRAEGARFERSRKRGHGADEPAARPTESRAGAGERVAWTPRQPSGAAGQRPPMPIPEGDAPRVASARIMVNPAGFAFGERLDGEGSIFIPPPGRGGAMDGDEAVVAWWPGQRGAEGTVRSVTRRARTRVTGILRREGKQWVIAPDDPRVLGRADVVGEPPEGEPGQVVVARIVDYPGPWGDDLTVQVEKALGQPGTIATEEAKILIEHGIDPLLPPAVLSAATKVPTRVHRREHENREDMRELDFMTIDPPDARDFDDAVCVEVLGRTLKRAPMRVFDDEAALRCFTCYLPDRAIPMLAEQLSSNICSLVPKKDRLAMVVTFELGEDGHVSEADVKAAVIHSKARLTYGQVADELSGQAKQPPQVRERIAVLREAADRLQRARRKRGAIELDLPEIKVLLDEDDKSRIRDVVASRATPEMTRAYNLIEELMIAANEGVARVAVRHRLPVVYRVHDAPEEERIERYVAVAGLLGVEVDPERLRTPKGFRGFLRKITDHPRRDALHQLCLRTLAQAEYSTHNIGHFALASNAYLHFTSPIRRYPDLINHRVLKAWPVRQSREQSERSNDRERATVQAERDAKALFSAAFMRDRIGDRFEGKISGLSAGGIYVTLDAPPVDGMVKRARLERELRERWELDELGAKLCGSKSKRELKVGDRVVVEVVDCSLERHQIELALLGVLTG